MTAKLFFDPDFGTVVVRDANEPVELHRENLLNHVRTGHSYEPIVHRPMPKINCRIDA